MTPKKQSRRRPSGSRTTPRRQSAPAEAVGALADGLGIGLAISDSEGIIRYGNATFTEFLTRDGKAAKSVNLLDLLAPGCRPDFEVALGQARWAPVHGKLELLSAEGELRTFRVSLSSLDFEANHPEIWILAHEVTELLEAGRALDDTKGSVHMLSGRLMQAQDDERRRMARDLHDITGQELAVILMSLTRISNGVKTPGADIGAEIAETAALVRKVENDIRTLSYILHPPMLDELGLKSALGWYVEGFSKRSNIRVEMAIPQNLPRLSREKELAVFRVVQESLTNVLRHAHSPSARIRAEAKEGSLWLYVEDSGSGFAAHALHGAASAGVVPGVGILGMQERLKQLGGGLSIESTSAGTRVCAMVPLDSDAEQGQPNEAAAPTLAGAAQSVSSVNGSSSAHHRILIVDDHELMRIGIRKLVESEKDLQVCGEARDGLEAVAKAGHLRPDLVILDLIMPRMGGFSAALELRRLFPAIKIIVFTNYAYGQVEGTMKALECQAYVSKSHASTDLIHAIRTVLAGDKFYDSGAVRTKLA